MMDVDDNDCYRSGGGLILLVSTIHWSSENGEHRTSYGHHQRNHTKKRYMIKLEWYRKILDLDVLVADLTTMVLDLKAVALDLKISILDLRPVVQHLYIMVWRW